MLLGTLLKSARDTILFEKRGISKSWSLNICRIFSSSFVPMVGRKRQRETAREIFRSFGLGTLRKRRSNEVLCVSISSYHFVKRMKCCIKACFELSGRHFVWLRPGEQRSTLKHPNISRIYQWAARSCLVSWDYGNGWIIRRNTKIKVSWSKRLIGNQMNILLKNVKENNEWWRSSATKRGMHR